MSFLSRNMRESKADPNDPETPTRMNDLAMYNAKSKLYDLTDAQWKQVASDLRELSESSHEPEALKTLVEKYEENRRIAKSLREAYQRCYHEFTRANNTSTLECPDVNEWGTALTERHGSLLAILTAVAFAGGGLTAPEGNIGLVTWSFCLFISSLFVMITMQVWAASMKHLKGNFRYPWASRLWILLILTGVAWVCAMEITAIIIMVVTSYGLHGSGREPMISGLFSFAYIGAASFWALVGVVVNAYYGHWAFTRSRLGFSAPNLPPEPNV